MKLLPVLLLCAATHVCAEVKVAVGDITDRRATGQFTGRLEINLKLTGPELVNCKGIRVTMKDATDDTGKVLPPAQGGFGNDGGFQPLEKPFGGFASESKPDEFEVKLEMPNPARAAKTLKAVNGSIELLLPASDAASVVTVNLAKDAGKPLVNDTLKAAGVEITLKPVKGSEVGYKLKDPKKKVGSIEFCSADGKPLKSQGSNWSSFDDSKDVSLSLESKPAADAVAKIYLATEKSVVTVPIALKGVPLP